MSFLVTLEMIADLAPDVGRYAYSLMAYYNEVVLVRTFDLLNSFIALNSMTVKCIKM